MMISDQDHDLIEKNKTVDTLTKRIFDLNRLLAKLEKINKEQEKEIIRLGREVANYQTETLDFRCQGASCYKPLVCSKQRRCELDDIPF